MPKNNESLTPDKIVKNNKLLSLNELYESFKNDINKIVKKDTTPYYNAMLSLDKSFTYFEKSI